MGFRYRKSINLGGGFRINLSKTGIGYSWGTKGYRVTKTANGRTRKTASIPGTGISFVEESGKSDGKNRNQTSHKHSQPVPATSNYYSSRSIENDISGHMVSEGYSEIVDEAEKTIFWSRILIIICIVSLIMALIKSILLVVSVISIVTRAIVRRKGTVILQYEDDEENQLPVDQYIDPAIKIAESSKVWRITQENEVIDKKYSGGAAHEFNREICEIENKLPFPFKTNVRCVSCKTSNEIIVFLPDFLLIKKGTRIGAVAYRDIDYRENKEDYVEKEKVPEDAKIVRSTWKYINKSGEPDQRFKDNKSIPVCEYGKITLTSSLGLNTMFLYSNSDI